jgi:hypothetical protein
VNQVQESGLVLGANPGDHGILARGERSQDGSYEAGPAPGLRIPDFDVAAISRQCAPQYRETPQVEWFAVEWALHRCRLQSHQGPRK